MCSAHHVDNQNATTPSSASMIVESCPCQECTNHTTSDRMVNPGDIVTIDLEMIPENGLVPEPLFDRNGIITFVVGWGNYLPGLHELVLGKRVGDHLVDVSIDAGWGQRNPGLVMELPKAKLVRYLQPDGSFPPVGSILKLSNGQIQLLVTKTDEEREVATVDANPPLAGASYKCSLKILEINSLPTDAATPTSTKQQQQQSNVEKKKMDDDTTTTTTTAMPTTRYKVATFALGCFWGGELAYQRVRGVVGTRVGYTQGTAVDPTYEAVCTGKTQHREAIMVVYDSSVVSYQQLIVVAVERLAATYTISSSRNSSGSSSVSTNDDDNNDSSSDGSIFGNLFAEEEEEETPSTTTTTKNQQYRHGFYYHSEEQRKIAKEVLDESNLYDIELKKAAVFYDAEEYHQQYLLKGGQSARKGAREPIRCYG